MDIFVGEVVELLISYEIPFFMIHISSDKKGIMDYP